MRKTLTFTFILVSNLSGCSTPSDVAATKSLGVVTASGDINAATYCVRKRKESEGTLYNSVAGLDFFPTPNGTELHLYGHGDHRVTMAIAYYSRTESGYSVDVKATELANGNQLLKWVRSCAS
ncbi:hypothetical protein MB818_21525, partial [Ruegeria sp. 1NDH52C]